MDIEQVAEIVSKISDGFEEACVKCLSENSSIVVEAIREQLYAGQNGEGQLLSPTYSEDPFFEEEGYWYHRADDYRQWKLMITPPESTPMLGLPPRPDDVPNLYINGLFYSEITARRKGDELDIDPGSGNGPAIVAKYGTNILDMGPTAKEDFLTYYMIPAIDNHLKDCGYK